MTNSIQPSLLLTLATSPIKCAVLVLVKKSFNLFLTSLVNYFKQICFLEYPSGCDTYYGPHDTSCLATLWSNVGCLAEGTKYPDKLSSAEVDSLTGIGLRWDRLDICIIKLSCNQIQHSCWSLVLWFLEILNFPYILSYQNWWNLMNDAFLIQDC